MALAASFPKLNLTLLAPLGACGLFFVWSRLSWKRAFWVGWFAGGIFAALSLSWIAHTVGAFLGNFAFIVVLGPVILEGPWFGLAGLLSALAYARLRPGVAPLAAAAAFTLCEWLRSIGVLGFPFVQLGYSQVGSGLAPLAAFAGSYGVTFAVCVLGAYLAHALGARDAAALRRGAIAWGTVAACAAAAWIAWPARHTAPPTMKVSAIQANIPQLLKWTPAAQVRAIREYSQITAEAAATHPALVVWPESVIPVNLNSNPLLIAQFAQLARTINATLVVGTNDYIGNTPYNDLYVFSPAGMPEHIYTKRQLVPFAEHLPAPWLAKLPFASLVSQYGTGHDPSVYPTAQFSFAPLICWESAFADLAHDQLRRGAQSLVIATDDAWFGETEGPFEHAQIAQMRAIEAGTWVVRAAATGISGIIAPDGSFTARSTIDTVATVNGAIGPPPGSLFAKIGPAPVTALIAAVYVLAMIFGARTRQW